MRDTCTTYKYKKFTDPTHENKCISYKLIPVLYKTYTPHSQNFATFLSGSVNNQFRSRSVLLWKGKCSILELFQNYSTLVYTLFSPNCSHLYMYLCIISNLYKLCTTTRGAIILIGEL